MKPSVVIAFVIVLLLGLWWGIPTFRKARADALVSELCAKDGGVKIFETVKLPPDNFGPYGNVIFSGKKNLPPLKSQLKPSDPYFVTADTHWIEPDTGLGSLAVWRSHAQLVRNSDGKVLGEAIAYSRRGGDPIGPWHPSSFGCPRDADIVYVVQKVFKKD
jgi:hypothetical protein